LRVAREQKNLELEEVAKATRIPQRHLASLETGDYEALPGRTYAIGFAKSYARAVDLSEVTISNQLREEMDEQGLSAYRPETNHSEYDGNISVPPKMLAWTAATIGAIILVGYLVWRTLILQTGDVEYVSDSKPQQSDQAANTAATKASSSGAAAAQSPSTARGPVILTATDTVWLKIYDENGDRLFEKEMQAGEKYTVPADAKKPQILTGRPDALTVTVGGKTVPPLGTAERTIKDVEISAASLLARNSNSAPPATGDN